MMAAYQTQPGAMHPGMAQPGHPAMTPGQPINPAQMQQMGHPGVSGPGIPHSQAGAMMGMQPGANGMPGMGGQMGGMPGQMAAQGMAGGIPNQAFSQMNPQMQQQVLQQQAAAMQRNPNDMQRQMALQQRMMQQRAMQQQGGGMQLSPQQLQQLQNSGVQGMHPQSVQLNSHLQQQMMAQRHQMAQAAAQQNQQAQQNQHLQQQLAMQHANSQSSNPGSQQGAPPNPAISQPQQPPQMRPQSRTANPTEQNHGQPPPTPQSSGPGQPQQPGQQTPQQNQQPSMPQQGPQAGMTPQMAMLQQRQRAAMAAQQQQQQQQQQPGQQQQGLNAQLSMQRMAAAAQAQAQAQSQGFSGAFVLRLLLLCNEISGFDVERGKNLAEWQQTINKHFGQDARIVHEMRLPPVQPSQPQGSNAAEPTTSTKSYEVIRPIIPKYFQTFYDSGATAFRIYPEHPRESFGNGQCQVVFQRCTFHVDYDNGSRLEMSGSLSFNSGIGNESNVVDYMEIKTEAAVEVITRKAVEDLISGWSPTMDSKTSPKMTKKPPKAQQKPQAALEGLTIHNFPKPPRGKNGPLPRLQAFLEVGETMNVMNELICFAEDHKMRPGPAMEALVAQYERESGAAAQQLQQQQMNNPHINYPPNGIPAGNRTPSMGNMPMPGQQFSSPAMSNLNAPMMNGSPHIANHPGLAPNMNMPNSHTPSPHQSNMAAPQMMPQHSQQGTNSSAASANTSPNVNNKRRRSTVKMEGDEGGGDGGPAAGASRVKPSPRMGNKKGKQS